MPVVVVGCCGLREKENVLYVLLIHRFIFCNRLKQNDKIFCFMAVVYDAPQLDLWMIIR